MEENQVIEKKPFNKKIWRDKKYGHSHKVDQWKEKHKLAAKFKYKRLLKKEQKNNPNFVPVTDKKKFSKDKSSNNFALNKAKNKYNDSVAKKQSKKEEFSPQGSLHATVRDSGFRLSLSSRDTTSARASGSPGQDRDRWV